MCVCVWYTHTHTCIYTYMYGSVYTQKHTSFGFWSIKTWTKHNVLCESESEVTQSCPTLCDPVDCSLPGSSIHGILQARILDWVAISFSKDKMLSIPNCCRNVNKMTMRYQNPPVTMDIQLYKQYRWEKAWRKRVPTLSVATASMMDSLWTPGVGGRGTIKGNKA